MSDTQFNDRLNWALLGKYVYAADATSEVHYKGWLDRIHHQRGSVVLHDAEMVAPHSKDVGSVFIRNVSYIHIVHRQRKFEMVTVADIRPSPYHDADAEPPKDLVRAAYRNRFAGRFPICREVQSSDPGGAGEQTAESVTEYELIDGHKRIKAAERAGLIRHPVEVIECTDEQARELVALAHDKDTPAATDTED